jgi:hypothetical protein
MNYFHQYATIYSQGPRLPKSIIVTIAPAVPEYSAIVFQYNGWWLITKFKPN